MNLWSRNVLHELSTQAQKIDCYLTLQSNGWVLRTQRDLPQREMALMLGMAGSWGRAGHPSVRCDDATLRRLSKATPTERPRSPWPAWIIELPKDQRDLALACRRGKLDPLLLIVVIAFGDRADEHWSYIALASRVEYTEVWRTAEELITDGWSDDHNCHSPEVNVPIVDAIDLPTIVAVRHLILSASEALMQVEGVERTGRERPARDRGRLPAGDYTLITPSSPT